MSAARAYELAIRQTILNPIIRDWRAQIMAAGRDYQSIGRVVAGIPATQHPMLAGRAYSAVSAHMNRLKTYHRKRFSTAMRRYFGVRVDLFSDIIIGPIVQRAILDNVALIKTIPTRLHVALSTRVTALAKQAAFDEQLFIRELGKDFGSAGYNARRIARDQTTKTIGEFNRARQQDLGITEYVWSSSLDNRVRLSHEANEGITFSWDHPPATGNPGEDIQCRCAARPVIATQRTKQPPRLTRPARQASTLKTRKTNIRKRIGNYNRDGARLQDAGYNVGRVPAGPQRDAVWESIETLQRQTRKQADDISRTVELLRKRRRPRAKVNATLEKITFDADVSQTTKDGISKFADLVDPSLVTDPRFRPHVREAVTDRPSAGWKTGTRHDVKLVKGGPNIKDAAHELGHIVEYANDDVFDKAIKFVEQTRRSRVAPRDKAHYVETVGMGSHWYQGKFYKIKREWPESSLPHTADIFAGTKGVRKAHIYATEVVSFGLEMYAKNPVQFLSDAPDYYWWIVDNIILPG